VKRCLILLFGTLAICEHSVFAQSGEEIRQAVREAAALYRGDFLPGQIAIVTRMEFFQRDDGPMICVSGCDPFSVRFTLPRPMADFASFPVSLQGPTSNQTMQLTPSRTAFTFDYD
jgi:hypothetical protein